MQASAILAEWHKLPQNAFLHQIVPVTIRFLLPQNDTNVTFAFANARNISVRYTKEPLTHDDLYYYKRLYCKIEGIDARLPDVTIKTASYITTLPGIVLQISKLNYPDDFCNVLARNLQILTYKSIQFNQNLNLIVIKLKSNLGNLEDFTIPYAKKGEIKEINESFPLTQIIYYAFLPSTINELRFSYFNTQKREFQKLSFPIKVKDEIVSTQSDINPAEDKNKTLKIAIFLSLGAILLLVALWTRSFFSAILAIFSLLYAGYLSMPLKRVCLKRDSKIYILPTKNSTIFRINRQRKRYIKLKEVGKYVKIELENNKVGWVKDEDLCKN